MRNKQLPDSCANRSNNVRPRIFRGPASLSFVPGPSTRRGRPRPGEPSARGSSKQSEAGGAAGAHSNLFWWQQWRCSGFPVCGNTKKSQKWNQRGRGREREREREKEEHPMEPQRKSPSMWNREVWLAWKSSPRRPFLMYYLPQRKPLFQ